MKMKKWIGTSVALLSLGSLTACGSSASTSGNNSSSAAPTASSSTLNIGLDADPPKLDPSLSSALVDRQVMFNIYDTLFQLTPDNKVAPDLVKSYEISKDGKTYTFHLQQNVKFQDGTPFDAAAVKFNIQRDQEKISSRRSSLTTIQSVDTPDNNTVVLHLSHPFSPLLSIFAGRAGMMVSPTAAKAEGSNFMNQPVGTGPYKFKDRVKGDHIDLVRNDSYWGQKPAIQNVTYKIFTDTNVEVANLQSGAVQIIDTFPAAQLNSLKSNSNLTVSNTPGLGYQGFYINVTQAPFNNKYLREAVNQAIDRSAVVNVVYPGVAQPGYSPFSSVSPVYDQQEDTPPTPNDATVKSLLAKGGHPSGFSFTMQVASSPVTTQLAQVIQGMLAKYGIQMKIQQLEFGTVLANEDDHNFQASQLGWSGRLDPDQDIYNWFVTGASLNGSNYSNPQVDKLLKQARVDSDASARTADYAKVMDIIHTDVPYVYLFHQNNSFAFTNKLKGFVPYSDGVIRVDGLSLS